MEKLVYGKGTNVALYNVERSKKYKTFQNDVEQGLNAQIGSIARDDQKMDSLLLLTKSNIPLEKQVEAFLSKVGLDKFVNIESYLIWAGQQGGQAALDKMGVDGIFGLKNPELKEYFADYSKLLVKGLDDTSKEWIAKEIQNGKDNGLLPKEIAKNLIDEGKGISKTRAEKIVLTETAKAMVRVETEVAERYGIKSITWRTSQDERTCPICLPLEGKTVAIGTAFPGGYEGPPAHPLCRCFIEEQVEGILLPEDPWLGE